MGICVRGGIGGYQRFMCVGVPLPPPPVLTSRGGLLLRPYNSGVDTTVSEYLHHGWSVSVYLHGHAWIA